MKIDEKPRLKLIGEDGNAFFIIGRAQREGKKFYGPEKWAEIRNEAMSGDYDHVLQTMMKYFEVY